MKRYYLSKIFQDVAGQYGEPGAWMHRLQTKTGIDYVGGEIKTDPVTGIPTEKALLCLVGGINHKQLQGDPELIPMPDVAKDMKVSAIHTATKLKTKRDIKAIGFADTETEAVWNNADGLRDVLNHYGQKNNPDFDSNNFDLDES
jgi:hypothetical protein